MPDTRLTCGRGVWLHSGPMELPIGAGLAAALIAESGSLETPFVLIDVGARDGIHPRWRPFEPALQVYGFDPIADVPAPNNRHRYFKIALGATDGACVFDVPDNPYEAHASTNGAHRVPMARLDTLWGQGTLAAADFIKIDCEGYEPEVLRGAAQYLQAGNLLGADVETSFHITAAHPDSHFATINAPLVAQRLLVAEFSFGSALKSLQAWNATCNVLFARHLVHEHRHPEHFTARPPEAHPTPDTILKTIALLDVYGLTGPAAALAREFFTLIADRIDAERLRESLVSIPSTPLDRFLPLWSGLKRRMMRLRLAAQSYNRS